jgi:adenylate kinase family enzyme
VKIAVMGYSGSGKSTLAKALGKKHGCEVLHLDTVQFLPNWVIRPRDEAKAQVRSFLDSHTDWVIDGNYSKLCMEERLERADTILFLNFNRFTCFFRAFRRYLEFRGKTRPDLGEDCPEKFDFAFISWLLWKGRTKERKKRFDEIVKQYNDKVLVIKNQQQLDAFLAMTIGLSKKHFE